LNLQPARRRVNLPAAVSEPAIFAGNHMEQRETFYLFAHDIFTFETGSDFQIFC
jgi:hypothetical protein